MARWLRILVLIVLAIAVATSASAGFFYQHWIRSLVASGDALLLATEPETLEQELRHALPAGASREQVERALANRHIATHWDEATRTLQAGAGPLKGSNPLIETSLSLQFHFDPALTLLSIESKVVHTGP